MSNPRATFAQAEVLLRAVELEEERGIASPKGVRTLPNMPVARALAAAVRGTLEVMFFVDVAPEAPETGSAGAPKPPAELIWVDVGFQGTRSGRMLLGLDIELAAYCHEGFQPEDSGLDFGECPDTEEIADVPANEPSGPGMEQSVLELGNIVCGSFLSNAWPDGLFRVEEPRLLSAGAVVQGNGAVAQRNGAVAERESGRSDSWPLAASCTCHTTEGSVQARVYIEVEGQ